MRESPSFELIEKLEHLGAEVDYNDPHVPATHKMRHHDLQMKSVPLTPQVAGELRLRADRHAPRRVRLADDRRQAWLGSCDCSSS